MKIGVHDAADTHKPQIMPQIYRDFYIASGGIVNRPVAICSVSEYGLVQKLSQSILVF